MSRQYVHRLFAASVLIKGMDGVLETIGGILFMFVSPKALNSLVISLTAHELSEDPDDWLATTLRHRMARSDRSRHTGQFRIKKGECRPFSMGTFWELFAFSAKIREI